jgi:hypothetical protein
MRVEGGCASDAKAPDKEIHVFPYGFLVKMRDSIEGGFNDQVQKAQHDAA